MDHIIPKQMNFPKILILSGLREANETLVQILANAPIEKYSEGVN